MTKEEGRPGKGKGQGGEAKGAKGERREKDAARKARDGADGPGNDAARKAGAGADGQGDGARAAREIALSVLMEALEGGAFLDQALHEELERHGELGKRDRAFVTRLSEGCVERLLELDYVLGQVSSVKVGKMRPLIRNILRMGAYQILHMDQVPDRAACDESVRLAERRGLGSLKGFVNGVLRGLSRRKGSIPYPDREADLEGYLEVAYSMPRWILALWLSEYSPEEVERALQRSLGERATSIRCNQARISPEGLDVRLRAEGVGVEAGSLLPFARKIRGYDRLEALASFREGLFQVQDESSMLAALAAGARPGDKVIDVCAAPGGKSCHVAELLGPSGVVLARDRTGRKAERIRENASRMGLPNVRAQVRDATVLSEEDVGTADVVLADLPCSGLGAVGRKPDIKYRVREADLDSLAALQREILSVAARYVRPGGILIYSTCTVSRKENVENFRWMERCLGLKGESLRPYLPEKILSETAREGYLQLFQGNAPCDGFFLCRMRKGGGIR